MRAEVPLLRRGSRRSFELRLLVFCTWEKALYSGYIKTANIVLVLLFLLLALAPVFAILR